VPKILINGGEGNMPGVWNVNNGYNINTKKVSSKLTFEVGEKFTGRVVAKGDGQDVTVKLSDGWQFNAQLEDSVDLDTLKLVKFQVDGFEDGKLKLKRVQDTGSDEATEDENFQDIIEKEGLSKDDIETLKSMVEHNIPLTRDNINQAKSLIQFNERINYNSKEANSFIQTYLQSKGVSADSTEGKAITELLTKFLDEYKNMTSEDILTFIENNLEFSEENINSFNKLFKGDSSIEQILMKINESLNSSDISDNISKTDLSPNTSDNNISETLVNNESAEREMELTKNAFDAATALASKAYSGNDSVTKKISVLDVLKTISGTKDSELDIIQKNSGKENGDINTSTNMEISNLPKTLTEKLDNPQIVKLIKDALGNNFGTDNLSKTQAERLVESTNKTRLEELLSNIDGKEIKLTDNEFKAFSELFNNKLQGKQVGQGNVFNESNISIDPKDVSTDIAKGAVSVKENVEDTNLQDVLFGNNADAKESIKAEMKDKINNVRDIVKELISQTDATENVSEKIMNLIKSNINDIKVFNSLSNEYYYVNIPITANQQEYPCKLIIKDNRKDGKKIDKTNTKMIVSVKTVNLGEVDGYLTMRDNRINVNLECDSDYTSIIKKSKSKLVDGLSTLGLFVNINVSSKDKPVDIVNCRNFFNDLTISAIDIKV
jgi:hypothetical protein